MIFEAKWRRFKNGSSIKFAKDRSVGLYKGKTSENDQSVLMQFRRGNLPKELLEQKPCRHEIRLNCGFLTIALSDKAAYSLLLLLQDYFNKNEIRES